ncbi:MAG: BrnT family toxin [Acidobacteria bacterium]|nr:BrnT family toxin [Acidobacteriota bacterium]
MYEWDPEKAAANLKKHKVSFEEGTRIFTDPFALTFDDPDHSRHEKRFITIGTSGKERVLFLAHVDRSDDHIRIISVRRATKSETHAYQASRKPQQ